MAHARRGGLTERDDDSGENFVEVITKILMGRTRKTPAPRHAGHDVQSLSPE